MKSRRYFRKKTRDGKAVQRQARMAEGEAGIFYIAKSDLMQKNADYIRGNRIMFGSISTMLLCVGLVNYFNINVHGNYEQEKRTGNYAEDWNDTPAGKKAVPAGGQLLCAAHCRSCDVGWIGRVKGNRSLYEKTAFLFYILLSGWMDYWKPGNPGSAVCHHL